MTGLTRKHPGNAPNQRVRLAIRQQVGACPVCGGSFDDHSYWDIASAVLGVEDDRVVESLISQRRWLESEAYQAANSTTDVRVWRGIRCPRGGTAVVPCVLTFGLSQRDYSQHPILLDEAGGERLRAFVRERWLRF